MIDQQQQSEKLNKAESARINGSKSRGAVTEQGKRNSANGNLRHGAYSKRILVEGEDPQAYEFFKNTFFQEFKPSSPFECECVESMVTARWRIRRIEAAEARLLNIALLANKPAIDREYERIDILHERAIAIESKSDSLETLSRLQERLHRIYERNHKLLVNSRRKRASPTSSPALKQPSSQKSQPNFIKSTLLVLVFFALLLLLLFGTTTFFAQAIVTCGLPSASQLVTNVSRLDLLEPTSPLTMVR